MSEYILEMKDISKSFDKVQVLSNVNLQVRPGEVHVLLGENGAGKSTLIKILSGAYKKEEGEIFLEGAPLEIHSPKEAIDKGISVIYQEFNLNPYVSIYENIFLGKEFRNYGLINTQKAISKAKEYMDIIGLNVDPRVPVASLSVAQKQMVEIIKAISANAKILVLDEPTAAITDKETEKLFEIVQELKKEGLGIIYISHRMQELFEIGDRCTVMRDGEYIKTLDLCNTNIDELTTLMVGRSVSYENVENPYVQSDVIVLKAEGLCYRSRVKDVSFELRKGEILGFSGLVGSGRTELAKCMIGAYKKDKGKVTLSKNDELSGKSIGDSIKKGIVYLSEDRKDEGLVLIQTISENIALPNLKKFGKFLLSKSKATQLAKDMIQKLNIKANSHLQQANRLSGGNQQKVVIAKWLESNADIYIFDEPTRGIDVGARDEIYKIMHALVKDGASIIVISSDMVEIQKICDRIVVMREGAVAAVLDNNETLTDKEILNYALHGGKINVDR